MRIAVEKPGAIYTVGLNYDGRASLLDRIAR